MWFFFDDIDIDCVNYADVTTPHVYDLVNEKVNKLPEKNFDKLFNWISEILMKMLHLKLKMKLLLTVLIKNYFMYYSIINLMLLHHAGKPPRS